MSKEIAKYVDQNLQQTNTHTEKDVKSVSILGIRKIGSEDVYNMEVDDTHCFAANGLIVHNCEDSLRYLCNTVLKYEIAGYI